MEQKGTSRMDALRQFIEFYRKYTMRFWMYVSVSCAFLLFFAVVMNNKNSRYNQRLEQSGGRISTRMQMMRENYLRQDSIFRHEQDSLKKLDPSR